MKCTKDNAWHVNFIGEEEGIAYCVGHYDQDRRTRLHKADIPPSLWQSMLSGDKGESPRVAFFVEKDALTRPTAWRGPFTYGWETEAHIKDTGLADWLGESISYSCCEELGFFELLATVVLHGRCFSAGSSLSVHKLKKSSVPCAQKVLYKLKVMKYRMFRTIFSFRSRNWYPYSFSKSEVTSND